VCVCDAAAAAAAAACRMLFENVSLTDMKSSRSATGVQMVGVFVANGLQPYTDNEHVSKDR